MLTSALIKEKAKELGATVCRIGRVYDEPNPQRGYAPCLCGGKCDIACYKHIKGKL